MAIRGWRRPRNEVKPNRRDNHGRDLQPHAGEESATYDNRLERKILAYHIAPDLYK